MKKFTKVLVVISLLLTILVSAVACATNGTAGKDDKGRFILLAPTIRLENNVVVWEPVRYGEKYGVVLNGNEDEEIVIENKTSYTLDTFGEKQVKVKVRAIGDDEKTVSSKYSNELTFTPGEILSVPQAPSVEKVSEGLKVSWNKVDKATSYEVSLSKDGKDYKKYTANEISLIVPNEDIKDYAMYNVKVRALSSDPKIMSSAYSDSTSYLNSKVLEAPNAHFITKEGSIGNIEWEKVKDATDYNIYLSKDGVDSDKVLYTTSTNSISSSTLLELIDKSNTDNDGNIGSTNGTYIVKIEAINKAKPEVFKNSPKVAVKKSGSEDIAEINKPGKPTNVRLEGDTLRWEQVPGYSKYSIKIVSGEDETVLLTDAGVEYNLLEHPTIQNNKGKAFEVYVYATYDYENLIIEGEAEKADGYYVNQEKELEKLGGDSEYKEYLKVENIGDFVYMLNNPTLNYYINNDIDGKKCNILGTKNTFTGHIVGNGHYIKNFSVINQDNTIELFESIGESGRIENVTFSNVKLDYDEDGLAPVDINFLAKSNSGLVSEVYLNRCDFKTNGSIYGLVKVNNKSGKMYSIGAMKCVFNAKVSVASVANENIGEIFGAASISNEIKVVLPIEDKNEKSDNQNREILVAGIANYNRSGAKISNSLVKDSTIATEYSTVGYNTTVIAGGIASVNSGSIVECYVEGKGINNKVVYVQKLDVTSGVDNVIVGGIAGKILANQGDSVVIDKTYFIRGVIGSYNYVGGIAGFAEGEGNITISNSYNNTIKMYNGTDKQSAYIVNVDNSKITAKNNYFSKQYHSENGNPSTNFGEEVATFADLVNKGMIEGYVMNSSDVYTQTPILANMLYANKYELTNYTNSEDKRDTAKIYFNGKEFSKYDNTNYLKAYLDSVGYKQDKAFVMIDGKKLVLPIFNEVKS